MMHLDRPCSRLISIVIGSLDGQLKSTFEKVAKLHAKNNFAFALIIGDLFPDPNNLTSDDEQTITSLLNGEIDVPLTTYFTLGQHALPQPIIDRLEAADGEVCPNLIYLGKRSTTKTSEGIRIVTLGGQLDTNIAASLSQDKYLPFHTEDDAKALHGSHTADILITTSWPAGVRNGSTVPLPQHAVLPSGETCIGTLCSTLKPRYHFSASSDFFFEREPFFFPPSQSDPGLRPITRFLSLASTTNSKKGKSLYAFSLDPNALPPTSLPLGTTLSPFTVRAQKRKSEDSTFNRFSPFNTGASTRNSHHRTNKRHKPNLPPPPSECFFCLSNPTANTHLVTSIAEDTYLTTAKGPLPTHETYTSLSHPCHVLIISMSHSPTFASISDPAERKRTYEEMQRYRDSLNTMIREKGKGELGSVTFEVSRASGVHLHWQYLPVSKELILRGLVEAAFKVEAENEKYPLFRPGDIGDGASENSDFFRVWIWSPGVSSKMEDVDTKATTNGTSDGDGAEAKKGIEQNGTSGSVEKCLVLPIDMSFRFSLNFGRQVMAKLMGLDSRFDWRECAQDVEEEKQDAEAFKALFKDFDFTT